MWWNVYANTMASAIEALGMSLPNSSAQEATSRSKLLDSSSAGEAIMHLITEDIKPRDIMTKEAFENAIAVVIALRLLQTLFYICSL